MVSSFCSSNIVTAVSFASQKAALAASRKMPTTCCLRFSSSERSSDERDTPSSSKPKTPWSSSSSSPPSRSAYKSSVGLDSLSGAVGAWVGGKTAWLRLRTTAYAPFHAW
ncbi:unnamed protein product [Prorocentrum cordatum]|uniref:Secreted protein n=1 Tax=Prorocentrum cordatum TaxID=2364126 RepID=A0ABN9XBP6_9DINO|nr:unnamed protein product [Polarella glacialis]